MNENIEKGKLINLQDYDSRKTYEIKDLLGEFVKTLSSNQLIESLINVSICMMAIKYRIDNKLSKKEMSKIIDIPYKRYLKLENNLLDLKLSEIVKIGNNLNLFIEISKIFEELGQYD